MSDSVRSQVKRSSVIRTFRWAGALVAVDAFFLNQGVLSAVVALWMLLVSLPRAAFAKDAEQRRHRLARVGIFVGAALLVFGLNWTNNRIAKSRAESLITAIKAFNTTHRRYPAKLDELVPEFIEHVPIAKYSLFYKFYYLSSRDYHGLFYVAFPPFGRPTYNFEKDGWAYLD